VYSIIFFILDSIGYNLSNLVRQERLLQSDHSFLKALEERKSLPIYAFQNAVMDAVHCNSVVIIRGNTGSGKTTQVSLIPQVKLG
jgi:HrpA-like RNA helicase